MASYTDYGYFKMVLGPIKANQAVGTSISYTATRSATHTLTYRWASTATQSGGTYGAGNQKYPFTYNYIQDYSFSVSAGQTISLPPYYVPGDYVVAKDNRMEITDTVGGMAYPIIGSIYAMDEAVYTPTADRTAIVTFNQKLTLDKNGLIFSYGRYPYSGFKNDYGLLTHGLVPLSSMRLQNESPDQAGNVLPGATGILTLKNHADTLTIGDYHVAAEPYRTFPLSIVRTGSGPYYFYAQLQDEYYYSPGNGSMRKSDGTQLGTEMRVHNLYLPFCDLEDEGSFVYRLNLTIKGLGPFQKNSLSFDFSMTAPSRLSGGCFNGDYCVGIYP